MTPEQRAVVLGAVEEGEPLRLALTLAGFDPDTEIKRLQRRENTQEYMVFEDDYLAAKRRASEK